MTTSAGDRVACGGVGDRPLERSGVAARGLLNGEQGVEDALTPDVVVGGGAAALQVLDVVRRLVEQRLGGVNVAVQ